MAREIIVVLTDDLDKESQADHSITIGWDGRNYYLDLSEKNYQALEQALRPYLDAAHRVERISGPGRRQTANSSNGQINKDVRKAIREWAREQGWAVSDHGRIPKEVIKAYNEAH